MTATAAMRAELRRMIDEPTTTTYSDNLLDDYIERYPMMDERGVEPYYYDTSTSPPTQVAVSAWYPSYDLHAAAADIWAEKASGHAEDFAIPTIEGTYQVDSRFEQYQRKVRFHLSRRRVKNTRLIPSPSRLRRGDAYVFNLAEQD
jgi:hypothetical protein